MLVAEKRMIGSYSSATTVCIATFILYVVIAAFAMSHHEPWGDEIHSWNIAKGSQSISNLIANTRYEGHPPIWYCVLWLISKLTHDFAYVQTIHVLIATSTVFLILFCSGLPLMTRLLAPFGYYFLFEYAVISRNYALGVLIAFLICFILQKNFRYRTAVYYLLLFLLTNTHLLAVLLAASIHVYFISRLLQEKKRSAVVAAHALMGTLVALPALWFIFPPADSQLNVHFWINRWNIHNVTAFIQAPLLAFIPVPAWWQHSSWNTQFLVEAKASLGVLKLFNLILAASLPLLAVFVLGRSRKATILFLTNFLLSFFIAVLVFPMTAERYAGFLFVGFMVAYWLYCYEVVPSPSVSRIVNVLLTVQLIGSVFIIPKDIEQPFSNAYKVNELLGQVPANQKIVSDYWALNTIATFLDRSFYCIDLQKEIAFIQWNNDLGIMQNRPYRYYDGVTTFFKERGVRKLFMISTGSPAVLSTVDPKLFRFYQVKLFDERDGAIEKGGNLYLYEINSN